MEKNERIAALGPGFIDSLGKFVLALLMHHGGRVALDFEKTTNKPTWPDVVVIWDTRTESMDIQTFAEWLIGMAQATNLFIVSAQVSIKSQPSPHLLHEIYLQYLRPA